MHLTDSDIVTMLSSFPAYRGISRLVERLRNCQSIYLSLIHGFTSLPLIKQVFNTCDACRLGPLLHFFSSILELLGILDDSTGLLILLLVGILALNDNYEHVNHINEQEAKTDQVGDVSNEKENYQEVNVHRDK